MAEESTVNRAAERELPKGKLTIPFNISDNSVNRYKWRLLVEGINMLAFKKNPVCLVMHNLHQVPIGKWSDLKVEKGLFTGTLEFDRNDPVAVMYYWKYTDGYMNAVSLHVVPITKSDDPELIEKGQHYATVTESDLIEISLAVVPGNGNAVKLFYADGKEYKLSIIQTIDMEKPNKEEIKELEQLKLDLAKEREKNAKNLVKVHQGRGVVTDGEIEPLTKLAMADYDTTEQMLDARKLASKDDGAKDEKKDGSNLPAGEEAKKLAEQMARFAASAPEGGAKGRETWDYMEWFKKDSEGLELMAKDKPEDFKKLEEGMLSDAKKLNFGLQ